jgi:hypothetical protein
MGVPSPSSEGEGPKVLRLELRGRDIPDLGVEADVVEPAEVLDDRQLGLEARAKPPSERFR